MDSNIRSTLILLAEAPDPRAIDDEFRRQLKELTLQETIKSDELLAIIDMLVFCSGCTDFIITVLNILWEGLLKDEGITKEEAMKNAEERRNNFLKTGQTV